MHTLPFYISLTLLLTGFSASLGAEEIVVESKLIHLRNGPEREWSEFPETADSAEFSRTFDAKENENEFALRLVHHDVKQTWTILLNDHKLGQLHRDENAIEGYWAVPPKMLKDGENLLRVFTTSKTSDDIRIGKVGILDRSLSESLTQAELSVRVVDADSGRKSPCRITVIHGDCLMTTGCTSDDSMAVRPGVIYCRGDASLKLPYGQYTIVAGRGPEHSVQSRVVTLPDDASEPLTFQIRREVSTPGLVACDTHVHTLTHSGHGDATVRERMLTLAGECVEFPIATDHNRHIDYTQLAEELGVRKYFTPVIGNEFTTKIGHFNIFPVESSSVDVPDHTADNWPKLFDNIFSTPNVKVAILNHARDVHSGYRPFGPKHFLAPVARNVDGWNLRANAMEVINSAAQQTDMMTLVHDWMAHLNAGRMLTPVGSSDSHDVARHFVAQGRTLIRCDDSDVSKISIESALNSFLAGRVAVSCGLSADIRVVQAKGGEAKSKRLSKPAGPGGIIGPGNGYHIEVDAIGPSWMEAHHVEVFVNGRSVSRMEIDPARRGLPGVKQTVSLDFDSVSKQQDVFVVAVVTGPAVRSLWWPVAKPYQPTSPDWVPQFMAVTGAVWIDADNDGKRTSARTYARRLCEAERYDAEGVILGLQKYDSAVGLHAADLLNLHDREAFVKFVLPRARSAKNHVSNAFEEYLEAFRTSERSRLEP